MAETSTFPPNDSTTTILPDDSTTTTYIDFEIFLSPTFSPYTFANTLILSTNNPSDTHPDLSTPLSRVLFDLQEVDTHIHTLTTTAAEPLLSHAKISRDNSRALVEVLKEQVNGLKEVYRKLEREVAERYETARPLSGVVENLARTVRLLRGCVRGLMLGRQLEVQLAEAVGSSSSSSSLGTSSSTTGGGSGGGGERRGSTAPKKEDPRALVRAAYTIVELRRMYTNVSGEAPGLETLDVMKQLLNSVITPADRTVKARAQQSIKEFSFAAGGGSSSYNTTTNTTSTASTISAATALGSNTSGTSEISTSAVASEVRARTTAAILVLHILSPMSYTPSSSNVSIRTAATTSVLTSTVQGYLQSQLTTSLASLSRSLTTLSTLDRTLNEVSTRAANIVALEKILAGIPLSVPTNSTPLNFSSSITTTTLPGEDETEEEEDTLLTPLLLTLDAPNLSTHFFRTLASNLDPRVREIMSKGGMNAKMLRDSRDRIRNGLRDCVIKGVNAGGGVGSAAGGGDAVKLDGLVNMMFGAVNALGR